MKRRRPDIQNLRCIEQLHALLTFLIQHPEGCSTTQCSQALAGMSRRSTLRLLDQLSREQLIELVDGPVPFWKYRPLASKRSCIESPLDAS